MAKLVPVDFDPFAKSAPQGSGGLRLVPVDFDPFAKAAPSEVAYDAMGNAYPVETPVAVNQKLVDKIRAEREAARLPPQTPTEQLPLAVNQPQLEGKAANVPLPPRRMTTPVSGDFPVQPLEEAPIRTGGTYLDKVLGTQTGMLTPEESVKATQEKVAGAEAAAQQAKVGKEEAKVRQAETLRSFVDKDGVPYVDKIADLTTQKDAAENREIAKQIQVQINNVIANAPFEFRQLLAQQKVGVSEEQEAQVRAEQAQEAAVQSKLAPPVTQTFARSALETAGQTIGSQTANTIVGLQRVAASPVSLIEAVTGNEESVSKEIDKGAKELNKALSGGFAPDIAQANDLGMKVVQGVASTAGFVGTGGVATKAFALPRTVMVAIAGGLPQAEQGWQEALRRQEEDPSLGGWRKWVSFATNLGIGASEALPIGNLFNRLEKLTNGGVTRYLAVVAANAGEEGVQEAIQQLLQNANSIAVLKDPNATLTKDVAENALVGALSGAVFSGGLAGATAGANQMRSLYKSPEDAPAVLRPFLFPEYKKPEKGEEAKPAAEKPTAAPEAEAAPVAAIPERDQVEILKGAGFAIDDIADMTPGQRETLAQEESQKGTQPVALTAEEVALFAPQAPAAQPSPEQPVEAPEAVSPVPPPEAPSTRAQELVEQGVPPLQAMQEAAAEPIAPAPAPAPVAEVAPAPVPEIQAAPVEPSATIPRVEVKFPFAVHGGETEVKVGDTYLPARYAVVDADNLKATLGKAINQFRDRERMGSQGQIEKIANAPDWNQLNAAPVMDFGSPTLDRNGLIVGGNGRFEGLSRAYERGNANRYRSLLKKNAGQFGIDPATFEKMKKPVLMRVIEADVDTKKLAMASNEGAGLRMSMLEQAKVDAERLPDLGDLNIGENGEISAGSNRDFIRNWTKQMPATEIGGIVDANGVLSQEGLIRLRNAVMHKAYGDSPVLGRIIESLDQGSKNIAAALVRSASRAAKAKELIASGDLYNLDIVNDILEAAQKFEELRAKGEKVGDYLAQGQMFSAELSPDARKILQFFGDHMRSAKAMSDLFNKYWDKVDAAGSPKQAGIFGEEAVPTKSDLLDAALKDARKVAPAAEAELPFGVLEAAPAPKEEAVPAPAPVPAPKPEVKAAPAPVAEKPVKQMKLSEAKTGQPFTATLYRGEPKEGDEKIEFDYPILGGARYTTPNRDYAKAYGSDIKEIKVSLKNPLVINNDTQWRSLTKSAGWDFPNPFGKPKEKLIKDIESLKKIILYQGYDGVIVYITKRNGFVDEMVAKTLGQVFDEDTVVEYKVPKAEENVAPVTVEKPAPVAEKPKGAPKKITLVEKKRINLGPVEGFITRLSLSNGKDIDIFRQKGDGGMQLTGWHYVNDSDLGPNPNYFYRSGYIGDNLDEAIAKVLEKQNELAREAAAPAAEKPAPVAKPVERQPSKSAKPHKSYMDWVSSKDQFSKSPNMPQEYLDVLAEWATMLGIKGKIHLMHDSKDTKNFDFGPARKLRPLRSYVNGEMIPYPGRNAFIIRVRDIRPRKSYNLEIIAHELGHVFENEVWQKSSKEEKDAVIKDYRKFLKENKPKNAEDYIRALRSHVVGKLSPLSPSFRKLKSTTSLKDPYWRSFDEYFADQVAKYMMSEERPQTIIGKYFARIADGLKRLYASLAGMSGKSAKSIKEYIDRRVNEVDSVLKSEDAIIQSGVEEEGVIREARKPISGPQLPGIAPPPPPRKPTQPKIPGLPKPAATVLNYQIDRSSVGSGLVFNFMDRFIDLQDLQKAIETASGAPLQEQLDAHLALQLYQDRAIARQDKAWEEEIEPMLDAMQKEGITAQELGLYAYAKHAAERNDEMRKRDPVRFADGGGSGLTDAEAQDILDNFAAEGKIDKLEELANKYLYPMIRKDVAMRYANGLLTQEQYNQYTRPRSQGGYDFYVPLTGYAEDEGELTGKPKWQSGVGKGFPVYGKEYRTAFGRESLALNPVFSVVNRRMEGITRSEKQRVDLRLYNLIKNNPNPEFAEIIKPGDDYIKKIGADGTVQYVSSTVSRNDPFILTLKIGGKEVYIQFNRQNENMARLVGELKNLGENAGTLMKATMAIGRYFSKINTQWVLDFFLVNFPRDLQDALVNLYGTKEGLSKAMLGNVAKSAKIIAKYNAGGELTTQDKALLDEWKAAGGHLDYGGYRTAERNMEDIERRLRSSAGEMSFTEKGMDITKRASMGVLNAIETINDTFDSTVRFAVYLAARQNGLTQDKAAQLSRRATVDFKSGGKYKPLLNALYPFSGAAIAGSRGLYRLWKSPRGRKALMSIVFISAMNSLLGSYMSDDDETDKTKKEFWTKIRPYERTNSIIIPIKVKGRYIKLPIGFYLQPFWVLGDQIMGATLGQVGPMDAATNVAAAFSNAFNPLGSGSLIHNLWPVQLRGIFETWTNEDWMGRQMHPEREGIAKSAQYYDRTSDTSITLADKVNRLFGGNPYKSSMLDIYPANIDYWAGYLTGGVGRLAAGTYKGAVDFMEGNESPLEKLPVIRRFVTSNENLENSAYVDLKRKVDKERATQSKAWADSQDKTLTPEQRKEAKQVAKELKKDLGTSLAGKKVEAPLSSIPGIFRETEKKIDKIEERIGKIQVRSDLTPKQKKALAKPLEDQIVSLKNQARKKVINKQEKVNPSISPLQKLQMMFQ